VPKLQANGKRSGASPRRMEYERDLAGREKFVADLQMPHMLDVAFLRSPVAHGHLKAVMKPDGAAHQVFVADDLAGVHDIRADSGLPGIRSSTQPILARDRLRHVGEPIAACLGASRALAEDLADLVSLDIEELSVVHDLMKTRTPLLHEVWSENVFLQTGCSISVLA